MNSTTETLVARAAAAPVETIAIRAAAAGDAARVYRLITDNLETGHLLARPLGEVELHVPNFLVATAARGVIGCGELVSLSPRVAEIRSLVVADGFRGGGIGRQLLRALVARAVAAHVPRVCAFTHEARPFVRAGFSIVPHPWVPEKIAADCTTCALFRRCRQYAVVLDLGRHGGQGR